MRHVHQSLRIQIIMALILAAILAFNPLGINPALAAGNDNNVEWLGAGHLPGNNICGDANFPYRAPLDPRANQAVTLLARSYKTDLTGITIWYTTNSAASTQAHWSSISALWTNNWGGCGGLGDMDIWTGSIPPQTTQVWYKIAYTDGSDTDWYRSSGEGVTGMYDDEGGWTTSSTTLTYQPPSTVYVDDDFTSATPGWDYDHFATIQNGADAVAAGGTVNVAAGTYVEVGQIVIAKNLTLRGEDEATTIIKPAQDTGSGGDVGAWILVNDGITFNLSQVTLDGVDKAVRQGIRVKGTALVEHVVIQNMVYPGYSGWGIAMGYNSTTATALTVSNSTFSNFGRVGILVDKSDGGTTNATVSGSTFVGKGEGDHLDYAIEVGAGAQATISDNTISACSGVASSDGSVSAAIYVHEYFGPGTKATISGNVIHDNTSAVSVGYYDTDASEVVVVGNSMYNNDDGVITTSTTTVVDASDNWWGTNAPAEMAALVSANVGYCPWLDAAPPAGTASGYLVTNANTSKGFCSIQAAIDDADTVAGHTLNVAAGTYAETVTVSKDVTLQGVNAPSGVDAAVINGRVFVSAAGATVQQLKIVPGDVTGNAAAISVTASDTTVADNLIDDMTGNGSGTIKGIHVYDGSSPALTNIMLTGNTVQNINNPAGAPFGGAVGIMVQGVVDGVTVTANQIGAITSAGWAYGIEVSPTASASTTPPKNVTLTHNIVSGVNPGYTNPSAAPYPGVGVFIGAAGTDPADAGQVTVSGNSFSNTPAPLANSDTIHILNASGNYLGYTTSTDLKVVLAPSAAGLVDYTPWLASGTDTSTDSGFQGDFSTLWVDDDSLQTGTVGRIQEGINLVSGSTVYIAPGTYIENVVVDKTVTLSGAGDGSDPAVDTILDGITLTGMGIRLNNNITGVTIEHLRVINYGGVNPSAGIYGNLSNHDLIIQDVTVSGNGPGSVSASGGIVLNGPIDNVLIDHVTATSNWGRGIVIWNGLKTDITITNNNVSNNNCCGIELQDGTASGVTMTGNTVENNTDSGMAAVGLMAGAGANTISGNTLSNNGRFGIEVKLPNGTGLTSGDGSIVVENNTVSRSFVPTDARDLAGIAVFRRGWLAGNVDIPTGVIVRNNTVSGYQQTSTSDGFGIVVEGTSMVVTGNTLNNNDVGVQVQAGHLPYTANTSTDGDQSNLVDQYFGRGNSPVGCASVSSNTFSGNTVDTRNVGAVGSSTVTNANTGESFCSIQAAIDDANTVAGHTLNAAAGTYAEHVTVNKAVTLTGAAGAIIDGSGSGIVVAITANNVTLQGFTIRNSGSTATDAGVFLNGVSACTVANNTVTGNFSGIALVAGANNAITSNIVNTNLAYGIAVVAGAGNTINLNTVTGNGADAIALDNASAVGGPVTTGSTGNFILGNTITSNRDGIFLGENCDSNEVDENALSSITSTGISAWRSDGHTLTDNTISGTATAIRLLGSSNNAITGNTLSGSSVGVKVDASWQVGVWYQSANNAIHQNNLASTTSFAVQCGAEQTAQVNGTSNWWGDASGPAAGQVSGNVLTCPWLNDVPGVGTASADLVTNVNTSEGFCTIQAAIDDAQTLNGHTINVSAGTYVENVVINKGVTLAGAGQGVTIVQPAISNPDCTAGGGAGSLCSGGTVVASVVIFVQASDVTIHDLTADGNNPALSSSVTCGGVDIDARNGIMENHTAGVFNNLTVYNTTIQNIFLRALYPSSGGSGFNVHHNTVQNVQCDGQSIAIMNYGGSGTIAYNTVLNSAAGIVGQYSRGAQILNNIVSSTPSGIHTDNNGVSGGVADLIQGNTVNCPSNGWGVWAFAPSVAITVDQNVLNGCAVGLAAARSNSTAAPTVIFTNNTVDGQSLANTVGVYVTTAGFGWGSEDVSASFNNNQIQNNAYGFYLESQAGYTMDATISRNTINGNTMAIEFGGDGTNVATIKGNAITSNPTVFALPVGTLTAYANNITGFTNGGLSDATGTFNARHNWWGTYGTQPTGVDSDSWNYRLGAPVASWSDGSGSATLGGASLTGTGTGVIVSHGRGLENVPFGKGNDPYASAMCSDYYDLFVLNGSGNWTAVVPVDADTACDVTFNTGKLYHFTLTGDMPDTTCSGSGCWNVPAGTTGASRTLHVTVDADALLQGTPFIAGSEETGTDPGGMDPTSVTLTSLDAVPQGETILVTWETATELENLGFNLYRGESPSGPWVKLNAELLAAQNPGATSGASYEWLDTGATPGVTMYYRLEDVDIHGASTFHGPISATTAGATAVTLVAFGARGSVYGLALALTLVGTLSLTRKRRR